MPSWRLSSESGIDSEWKKKLKQLLTMLFFTGASLNAQTNTNGFWQYTVSNSEATITGYTGTDAVVTIPGALNGLPVTKIGNGISPVFGNPNTNVTSITVPDSVTTVGVRAFTCCTRLLVVFVPDGIRFEAVTNAVFETHTTVISPSLLNTFATNDTFITSVANKIKGTDGNYGIATQNSVSNAISVATFGLVTESQIFPLATKSELTNALNQSRPNGIIYPNLDSWTIYSTNDIAKVVFQGLEVTHTTEGDPVFNCDIEQSDDLQNWTAYQEYGLPLTNLPTNKAFVRIRPRQRITNIDLYKKIVLTLRAISYLKIGAATYYGRYNVYPEDGTKLATVFGASNALTRLYADFATVSTNTTTFGDILLSDGLIDIRTLYVPLGTNSGSNTVTYSFPAISISQDGSGRAVPTNSLGLNYPMVFCRSNMFTYSSTQLFTGSANSTRVVFLLIPGLSKTEATSLKTFIDGPFWYSTFSSAEQLVLEAVAGTSINPLINVGNCRLTPSPLPGGGYDAWCYIQND